jgi:hypothetical protein
MPSLRLYLEFIYCLASRKKHAGFSLQIPVIVQVSGSGFYLPFNITPSHVCEAMIRVLFTAGRSQIVRSQDGVPSARRLLSMVDIHSVRFGVGFPFSS